MLLKYIQQTKDAKLSRLITDTRSGLSTAVFGVTKELAYYISSIIDDKVLFVTSSGVLAKECAEEVNNLTGEDTTYLPPKDDVLLYKKFFNKDSLYNRIRSINKINSGVKFVSTTIEALMQLFPKKLDKITLSVASEYPLDGLIKKLISFGYKRKEFAEEVGDFALRGDILEVYPIGSDVAYRCDFFGDDIESIRLLDIAEHKPTEDVRSFYILPTIDFTFIESDKEFVVKKMIDNLSNFKTADSAVKGRRICSELTDLIDNGNYYDSSLSFVYPLLSSTTDDFTDILKGYTVVLYEPKLLYDSANSIMREHTERCITLKSGGEAFNFTINQITSVEKLFDNLTKGKVVSLQNINASTMFFKPNQTLRFNVSTPIRYVNNLDTLYTDLKGWQRQGYQVIIPCGSNDRCASLSESLSSSGVDNFVERIGEYNGAILSKDYYQKGFILHDEKLAIIGTCDLFLSGVKEKKIIRRKKDTFSAPEVGDFAVHETYGIGVVRGMEKITTLEGTKEYLSLEYAGGDFLYIPTEDFDKLTKYLGGENSPHLNKLGGGEFERIKERARESISKMTINLKKLYKERELAKGFKFSPDNELTIEFDNSFEYDLTEDQVQSIAEIKKDMESDKIMDRLLMGDVGFGKTEVAIRAMFKAVMDNKQVAFLAPTTILTEQHYQTLQKRFKDFGVNIVLLNRFVSQKQMTKNIEMIISGEANIVVGTHRMLNKDIVFKDLGLLVLDEEQCFGVEAKEKLRTLKNNVDTLTMTATPIPRTLHMSLSGIRSMSLINTPPSKRLPVQTYVLEESDLLIRDSVLKELSRDGQVFILYNRVESINTFASHIKDILPEAKVVVGHGQMNKTDLEQCVMAFFRGEYNVLISTTIIENGIDLPNANTLIVIDADNLGLFTLYQLKGRVGRSDKVAHAYFTYKPDKILNENAYKRLSALMENTELGSGYKIAMRDLEIRGAGNVLGKEQHGHMDKIGYELYAKLLKEQLGEVTKDYEVELDVRVDAYIPTDYITESSSRMDTYKDIASIKNNEEKSKLIDDLTITYGKLPSAVYNLIEVAKLKYLAKSREIIKVYIDKECVKFTLKDINSLSDGKLNQKLKEYKNSVLYFENNPIIKLTAEEENNLYMANEFLSVD